MSSKAVQAKWNNTVQPTIFLPFVLIIKFLLLPNHTTYIIAKCITPKKKLTRYNYTTFPLLYQLHNYTFVGSQWVVGKWIPESCNWGNWNCQKRNQLLFVNYVCFIRIHLNRAIYKKKRALWTEYGILHDYSYTFLQPSTSTHLYILVALSNSWHFKISKDSSSRLFLVSISPQMEGRNWLNS